jgi:multiple sugar transport system substrate-binding protein
MTMDRHAALSQGRLSRRDLLRRAAVLGLSASAVGAFLAACGSNPAATTAPSAAPASAAPVGSAAPAAGAAPTTVLGGGAVATSTTAPAVGGTATRASSPVATAATATRSAAAATPSTTAVAGNVITSKSGFKGTLQYWVLGYQPNGGNQTGKLMDAATAAFTKANPDIKIETTGYTGDQAGFTKVTQAVQGGGGSVDIFRLPSDILPLLAQDNLLAPIDTFLTADDKADIFANMLSVVSIKGKAYSWPLWVPPVGMYLNLDIFKEQGVDPPKAGWTYDQFVDIAKKLTFTRANGDKVYGYSGGIDPGLVNTWPFIIGDGALPLNGDNTKYTWNTPQGISGLKKLADLALVHKVTPPDFGSVTVADLASAFQDKKVLAMYSEPSGSSAGYRANKLNFDVVPMPIGGTGKPITAGGIGLISVTAIKDTAKLQAAMDLGRYLTSAQVNNDVPGFYLAPGARKSVKVADPIDKFTPLVENCYITPIIAEWPQIRTILHPYIQNAVFGKTTPDAAFNDPAKEIDGILAARK